MLLNLVSSGIPLFMIATFFIFSPTSVEDENKKLVAKGKTALTVDEFQHKQKRERIIASIIVIVAWIIGQVILYVN